MLSRTDRPGTRGRGASTATRRPATRVRPSPTPEQVRALLTIAVRPALLAIVVIATCVLVTLVAANSDLTGTSGAVAAGWLAVHQVQLTIGGASLGVLPLLPTLVMVAAVARGCARVVHASTPRHECWWVLGAAVAGPVVVTLIALAVVMDASSVIALDPPNGLAALAWVVAVHLVGAGIGIGLRLWRPAVTYLGVPDWVLAAARPALRAAMALLATGAAITVASLLASWSIVGMLVEAGDGFMGGLGLTVLSILYLPNVVIAATAVLVGSAAHVGVASISLFDVVGGPVPALPVLGALPEQAGGDGWLVALVIPAAIGVMFGRDCARRAASAARAAQTALVGAFVVAVVFAVLGFVAGGALGSFGSVGVTVATFAGATFGWLAPFGAVSAALVRWRSRVVPAGERPDGPAPRPRPEPREDAPALPDAGTDDTGTNTDTTAPEPDPAVTGGAAPRPGATVLDAELLEDAATAPPVADIDVDSVVDAEVVDESTGADDADEASVHGVARVTDPRAESDLPDGTPTSSD
ncbi:DUF6350 family protein [Rhodococcus sp. NPDC003318]|uniref:cell division protein PerM n=1 Tax=Rhodococcus sp. NPDC003318 TaxID=3364503 RepID=UPI0036AA9AFD